MKHRGMRRNHEANEAMQGILLDLLIRDAKTIQQSRQHSDVHNGFVEHIKLTRTQRRVLGQRAKLLHLGDHLQHQQESCRKQEVMLVQLVQVIQV